MTTNCGRPTEHGISRQTFLRGAASMLATGAMFGTTRAAADPGAASWNGLASTIGGSVVLPANGAQFTSSKQIFNSFYNNSNPVAVVTVSSQADVQKAVAFATANKLKIAPRGGGHSYIGASSANGTMVLDLRGLPGGANLDGGNVTVTPAANLWAVHQASASAGRGVPTGSCPTVGIAGLTLGGGIGADSRHAGLTCDVLQSATVVLPSGDVVTASPNDHPDLFWALRGGGGGNFGVTTSMTFGTFAAGDTDVVRLEFAPSAAVQALAGWQTWLDGADRNAWAMVDLAVGGSEPNCHILATCPAGGAAGMADAIKSAVGLQPSAVTNKTMNRMDLVTYLAGGSSTSSPRGFVAGSDMITTINSAAAHAIATAIGQWPASAGRAWLLVDPLGGAIADVAPGDSAFPWRKQSALLQWYVEPAANQVSAATQWLSSAHQAVQQFSVGGYVNYLEPNSAASRYFGSNLSQLNSVRQKYDPNQTMFSGLKF